MAKPSADKHIITYESKAGKNWVEQTIKLSPNIRVGAVLREMRAQDVIRNVKLVHVAQ